MALLQTLRSLVTERLSAAAEEICGTVGQIVAAYEDEVCSLKQEIDRQRRLLDMVLNPNIKLHRSDGLVKDEPQQPQIKEQDELLLRPGQHMNSSLLQEEPQLQQEELLLRPDGPVKGESQPPQITQEQEEILTSTEQHMNSGQLQQVKEEPEGLLLRPKGEVPLLAVKHEFDAERREAEAVTINSLEHSETKANVEENGTPQPTIDDLNLSSHSPESDTEVCDELEETKEYQSVLRKSHVQLLTPSKQMKCHTEKKMVSCKDCGKMFKRRYDLNVHTRIHTNERPFTCIICGKGFCQKGNLKMHVMKHTGERPWKMPFTCTVCGKICSLKSNLKVHMFTHTKMPFTCAVCGRGCVSASSLKTHMMTHTGERPFTCTVCDKGFVSTSSLKMHMRTHTGERPFMCTICGKAFVSNSNLKTHMKTH